MTEPAKIGLFTSPATQPPDALPAGQKRARGAYYTPDALALAICGSLVGSCGIAAERSILEPGCGGGAFLRAASRTWPGAGLRGIDLVPACEGPGIIEQRDLFGVQLWREYSLVLGNPDFGRAEEIVRHCLDLRAPGGHLAFLLRLNFLGSKSRADLYREHPLRYFQPVSGRPSFTGGGTDASEYGLFVWEQGFKGRGEILPPLVWR